MNTKKLQDIKIIKNKINATFQLLEELEQLTEDFKELNINDNYLMETFDDLESFYWEIEDIEQEIKED